MAEEGGGGGTSGGGEYCLYSWGANSYGQLGVDNIEDSSFPLRICSLSKVDLEDVLLISGGGGHTVLLTNAGQILAFGWNKCGQLGLPARNASLLVPSLVVSLRSKVKYVSCGWSHTLALLENGQLVSSGSNTYGQLGVAEIQRQTEEFTLIPQEVFSGCSVSDVSAGLRHSVAVTAAGALFAWGSGRKGQLGLGKNSLGTQRCPTAVRYCKKVTVVRAGAYHSIAIVGDGSILSWGLNQHGQCGCGHMTGHLEEKYSLDNFSCSQNGHVVNIYVPMEVEGVAPLRGISCGWSHTVGITKDRRVLTWGRCDYGQLGREVPHPTSGGQVQYDPVPREVPSLAGVKQVECGSEHSLAITGDGKIVTFGWNEHGQCGTGDEVNVMGVAKTTLDGSSGRGVLVGTGAGHSLALVMSQPPVPKT